MHGVRAFLTRPAEYHAPRHLKQYNVAVHYIIVQYTILYYTILYYDILCYTILLYYYTILYYTILFYIVYTIYFIIHTIYYILYTKVRLIRPAEHHAPRPEALERADHGQGPPPRSARAGSGPTLSSPLPLPPSLPLSLSPSLPLSLPLSLSPSLHHSADCISASLHGSYSHHSAAARPSNSRFAANVAACCSNCLADAAES